MAIKAGQILHAMNRSVVDRIQTAGAGDLNIPTEKVRELGNYQSVATVRDVPDLSFNLDCLDVDTNVEALLTGVKAEVLDDEARGYYESDNRTVTEDGEVDVADVAAPVFDLLDQRAVDIISPWKSRMNQYDIVRTVAIPHLTLESASYSYGLRDNAGETFTLRGDSIFYVPGSAWQMDVDAAEGQTAFTFQVDRPPHPTLPDDEASSPVDVTALLYREQGEDIYALNVSVDGERMVPGDDYTETATGIEFKEAPRGTGEGPKNVKIVFGFRAQDNAGLGTDKDIWPQNVHSGLSVKPAAVRGKDIDLYVAVTDSPTDFPNYEDFERWTDVQSFNVDWSATIEDDFEFGNARAVNRDYTDEPEVTGSVDVRHRNPEALFNKLREITGVSDLLEIIGPQSTVTCHVLLKLKNPEGHGIRGVPVGTVLKTLYCPDARFVLPGYEGQVEQKLDQSMSFESDGGILRIFKGDPITGQFMNGDGEDDPRAPEYVEPAGATATAQPTSTSYSAGSEDDESDEY